MKTFIITVFCMIFYASLFAQTFEFTMQGDTLVTNHTGNAVDFKGYVYNLTGGTIETRWRVFDLNFPDSNWTFVVCDNNLCYAPGIASKTQFTLPNDTSLVKTTIYPASNKLGSLVVEVCDVNNPSDCEDYTLTVDATTSTHELANVVVFTQNAPNPFEDYTRVKYDLKGNDGQIVITDVAGRQVSVYNLNDNTGQIEIGQELARGLYFYTLTVDGQAVVTKRLQKL